MGMIASRVMAAASTWSPLDDRWYMPSLGLTSDSGIAISPETLFLCDTVLAAVRFKADAVAVCPPKVFRRSGDDRQPQPDHYAQIVLRDPNLWQTSFEWTHLNVCRVSTWGNAYNRIMGGATSVADELRPLHPACTRVVDQRNDGGLVYVYRDQHGSEERIQQEEMLHYRGISLDGYSGIAMYQLIRNVCGIALAAEKHMSMFLRKGTRLSGILSTDQPLTDDLRKRAENSWNARFGDLNSEAVGGVAMLGAGLKFQPMAVDHQKAQFLELQNFLVEKILRFLGVPGVVVGYQGDKASTYASADAFFEKGGIKHCILPLVMSMEQRDDKVLLPRLGGYFIKRDLAALLRASTKDTFDMLVKAAGRPLITGNEGRSILDLNHSDDPGMDSVALPANVSDGTEPEEPPPAPAGPPTAPPKKPSPAPPDDEDAAAQLAEERDRSRRLALAAAARLAHREVAALKGVNGAKGAALKFAADPPGWRAWVVEQYERHAGVVARDLAISEAAARAYCDGQVATLLAAGGLEVAATWEETIPPRLAAIALGGSC